MSTDFRLHIDPADVLGVSREATIQEIHEAYRSKAKRYHPDLGGEDWAFRILSQSYEIMSKARVALRASSPQPTTTAPAPPPRRPQPSASAASASASSETRPPRQPSGGNPFSAEPPRQDSHESVRAGVQEPALDPAQVVDVEKVTIRYEAEHVWLITDRSRRDRFLSSCLNVTWPDPASNLSPATISGADAILRGLSEAFDALSARSSPVSSSSTRDDGRFSGWLSYPDDAHSQAAFVTFRELLHGVGLVVKQWSRDLVIPKQWR